MSKDSSKSGRSLSSNSSVGRILDEFFVPEPAKTRGRKPTAKSAELQSSLKVVMEASGPPMSVRQVFYAALTRGLPKTERAYNRVKYHLLHMRRNGDIPYGWITDSTRWMRKPETYRGLDEFLEITKQTYRRSLWASQAVKVEIWCEKDALAGVLYQVTREWDVPLMVTRGYASETFVYNAAEEMRARGGVTHVYYFGDWDPSGQDAIANTRAKLQEFGAPVYFEVAAINGWQIEEYGLPTRPTKRSDSRARSWSGGSVELDAIPPNQLRSLASTVITQHIDLAEIEQLRRIEQAERRTLDEFQSAIQRKDST